MTGEVDRLMDEVLASRPPGWFDEALVVLRAFCEAIDRGQRAAARLHRLEIADPRHETTVYELCAANLAAADLAEALRILPGDQGPPPRLQ